jgi:hypothetical protein
MTVLRGDRYSQLAMNELQHVGAFVIQFRTGTDFTTGRIAGRAEHVASGRSGQFESVAAMVELIARLLKKDAATRSGATAPAGGRVGAEEPETAR